MANHDKVYPHRCRVRFNRTDLAIAGKDALWGVSRFDGEMRTTPQNLIYNAGGFVEITGDDYAYLTSLGPG